MELRIAVRSPHTENGWAYRSGMMRVTFLGVGEACDERLPNTSLWVEAEVGGQRRSIMLDCGFTAPPLYWRQTTDQEDLDALWISHFHGDHFFGTPALLLRFWEQRRKKPLAIVGQKGIEDLVPRAMDLAYPNFISKLTYPLEFVTVEAGKAADVVGLAWRFARNEHSQRDLAVRLQDDDRSIFYSGDGRPTPETLSLARGCDLVIHEAFRLEQETPGHGTMRECIGFARQASAGALAIVHVQRDERRERYQEIMQELDSVESLHVLLPEPGDVIDL